MTDFPSYLKLYSEGSLEDRLESLASLADPCRLCPRECLADRTQANRGYCRAPRELFVSSASPHFGEEPPLVGKYGSGTIFMTYCSLRCTFCQNYEISIYGQGARYGTSDISGIMLDLQRKGCHNINLVTPTHYVYQIVKALPMAIEKGLSIPLVYNTGGYDSIEVIRLLDGIIDIYMPDIKFMDRHLASRYCQAENYPDIVGCVVKEMYRQVGDLVVDNDGIARRGLLVRHLQIPSATEDTRAVLDFIASVSRNTYVNIMSQYYPCYKAEQDPEIARRITFDEHQAALDYARSIHLIRARHY